MAQWRWKRHRSIAVGRNDLRNKCRRIAKHSERVPLLVVGRLFQSRLRVYALKSVGAPSAPTATERWPRCGHTCPQNLTRSSPALPLRGPWGPSDIMTKEIGKKNKVKKNWLSHDNQSFLNLNNLIPWKTHCKCTKISHFLQIIK